jgi:WD40 repeat protein
MIRLILFVLAITFVFTASNDCNGQIKLTLEKQLLGADRCVQLAWGEKEDHVLGLTSSYDANLKMTAWHLKTWHAKNGKELESFELGWNTYSSRPWICFNTKRLVVAIATNTGITVGQFDPKKKIHDENGRINQLLISPDGKYVVWLESIQFPNLNRQTRIKVKILNTETRKVRSTNEIDNRQLMAFAFSNDSSRIAMAFDDEVVEVRDSVTFEKQIEFDAKFNVNSAARYFMEFSPDDTHLIASAKGASRLGPAALKERIKFWDLAKVDTSHEVLVGVNVSNYGFRDSYVKADHFPFLKFSPDGKLIYAISAKGKIVVWDLGKKEVSKFWRAFDIRVHGAIMPPKLFLSADGKLLAVLTRTQSAVGGDRSIVKIYDTNTYDLIDKIDQVNRPILDIHFSPDSSSFATREQTSFRIWNVLRK